MNTNPTRQRGLMPINSRNCPLNRKTLLRTMALGPSRSIRVGLQAGDKQQIDYFDGVLFHGNCNRAAARRYR